MQKEVVIFSYSGHSFVIIDALLENNRVIKGYLEEHEKDNNPFQLKYLGFESHPSTLDLLLIYDYFVAIGDNYIRKKVFNSMFEKLGKTSINIIHPSSFVSKKANLASGIFVSAKAVVNALVTLKNGVIVNSGAIIEHECNIGNFAHIAPGAVLAGNVSVGENSFIGAGAVIKQGIKICNDVIIGAGAVVVNNIEAPGTYIGVPAKKL